MKKNRDHDFLYLKDQQYFTTPKHTTLVIENLLKDISFGKDYTSLWDIGCSNGSMLNYLQSKFTNCKFFGSDIIPESIELAKQRTSDTIEYFIDDITKKKNTPIKCDVLISVGVLQIYDDVANLIQNYLSRSEDEGYILLQGPFNKYDVDLNITYRDNKNTRTNLLDQGGWNIWSLDRIGEEIKKIKEIESFEFIPIVFPDSLKIQHNKEDPLRSWTTNVNGVNQFLNALILQDHYVVKLKVNKSIKK